jgi:regulator of protease activity HflC (stomatin/prohibitin superfamily)
MVAFALFLLVSGLLLRSITGSVSLIPVCLSSGTLILISLITAGRTRFARHEVEEKHSLDKYRSQHLSQDLFEDTDDAVKLAERANQSFVKYVIPTFSVALGAGITILAVIYWRQWDATLDFAVAQRPLPYATLSISLFIASIVAGSYFIGVSREAHCRWLRPCGAWTFFTGGLFLIAGLVLIGDHAKFAVGVLDVRAARVGMALLALLGVEMIISFIIEFYRPRTLGEEEHPLFESRVLALFTEPGGVARNVALSLDYQFGFQVSEAWFYRMLERTLVPFLIVMVFCLWLLTCMVVVKSEENGIRERFGNVVSEKALSPGFYVKLPWPFSRIYTFPVERVQQIPIGYKPGLGDGKDAPPDPAMEELQGDPTGRVIVWSKTHNKEETNFIAASKRAEKVLSGPDEDVLPVPVYFISASIPLYFKVNDLYAYAYKHQNPLKTLEEIATREVVHYLAQVDFFKILTTGRAEGGRELGRRIQAATNKVGLGIQVVFIGLEGLHPPVRVGKDFDDVVAAMEEKHADVFTAEAYAIQKEPLAQAQAMTMRTTAESYKLDRLAVPKAEAERFNKQLMAYDASPRMFVLTNFLDVLEQEGSQARKYVVAAKKSTEVFILNLEKKLRPDLLDLNLNATE